MNKWLKSVLLAAVFLALLISGVMLYAVRRFPERHAKSSLEFVTLLADEAVFELIPEGHYKKAIENAEYIKIYYPVGTVLKKEHAFAVEYERRRREQISRILLSLKEETGLNFGNNLNQWKETLANQSGDDNSE